MCDSEEKKIDTIKYFKIPWLYQPIKAGVGNPEFMKISYTCQNIDVTGATL